MNLSMASRIPLVRRHKAPALPLDQRITHLTGLAVELSGASHHDLVARASGVLNYAALVASDVGIPDLAADLCWRQHQVFAGAGTLTEDIAVMSLMPLINISRLLTREGDGEAAYDVLTRLYRAALKRGPVEIRGNTVDLSVLTATDADHRKVCQELWVTVLVDGARALARIGRWTGAAEAMTAHRGIGNRLLDGRQIMIMSLLERGLYQQARDTIESSVLTEPWENTVAALLHVCCRPPGSRTPQSELDHALQEATALLAPPDASTVVFQARVGLTALELVPDHTARPVVPLREAIANMASRDAYAAREVLNHPVLSPRLACEQRKALTAVISASGLGAGELPQAHMNALTESVEKAEAALGRLLYT
ncbi:type I toxin-antitoxin system ptaRNA1 family toxin [Streptomyces tsukubensis]|uniref:Uncharacterized protein n=1 Tax=Streptomyces tsukubensis TaxID=83656 RepID=A0A1V4A5C8_9ACTN|nr:type I toxin-antitoxin system ptaRNA1 family toxin [Streptomyces tsukubensis]OON75941.1 hypothetical protein B1H18_21610 [Streptomyces tsukubensis]QFR94033.1 hypothetical protein GBW32_14390 [Streptomyces tsukubensis]